MKRIGLFALAALAAALIVGAALVYRQQNQAAADSGIALLPVGLTPSPVATGLLQQPQAVPFPGTVTAVIPHDFFPLSGAHATLACAACHDNGIFAGMGTACIDCHAVDDVHNGANGPDCALCHVPTQWQEATFDHSVIGQRDCGECHSPPPNHFPGACSSCHIDSGNFRNVNFVHTFPLDHGDANGQCSTCHAGNDTTVYTCTACHEQKEMIEEHADEDIFDIANCVACHADGEEPDD